MTSDAVMPSTSPPGVSPPCVLNRSKKPRNLVPAVQHNSPERKQGSKPSVEIEAEPLTGCESSQFCSHLLHQRHTHLGIAFDLVDKAPYISRRQAIAAHPRLDLGAELRQQALLLFIVSLEAGMLDVHQHKGQSVVDAPPSSIKSNE